MSGNPWTISIDYGPEGEQNYANVFDGNKTLVGNLRTHHANAIVTAVNSLATLQTSGREFMEAAEAVFDWMNGNDLSADHEEQHPDDFERVSKALVVFRAALSGSKE